MEQKCFLRIRKLIYLKKKSTMTAFIFEAESSKNLKLLLSLADQLGVKTHKLSPQQLSDHHLAAKIEAGMKTGDVSRDQILSTLGKL